ncbi:MAG: CoA ester lyase [Burkholderiales bacterium]|nr:CoA ester lyase [Burkholderiales bacterium]
MRSKLFVPGSRPELFAKALASAADALSFDLEDSVTPERKAEARDTLAAWLRSGALDGCTKTIIVRINAMASPHFAADLAAVSLPGIDLINLPKPASVDAVRAAAAALEQAERANHVTRPISLLLNIESAFALRNAYPLASAHPRVAGLQLGLGDLFEPLGIERREPAAVEHAMFMMRMAAGEAGVFAYDAAFANIRDTEGFRTEAALAKRLGFLGKSCIHPSQIALANEAFRPSDEEIAHSLRVLDAAKQADGKGAYMVDGRMIDPPFFTRAQQIVAVARRMELIK